MSGKKGKFLWGKEATLSLIELYQNKRLLYTVDDPEYKNKIKRQSALEDIKNELLKLSFCAKQCLNIEDIKIKIHTMRSQFNKEMAKVKASEISGSGVDEVYIPKLWFYDHLLFLTEHDVSTKSISNLVETEQSEVESEGEVIFEGNVDDLNNSAIPMLSPAASKNKIKGKKNTAQKEVVNLLQSATAALQEYRGMKQSGNENEDDIHNFFMSMASEVRKIENVNTVRALKKEIFNIVMKAEEEYGENNK